MIFSTLFFVSLFFYLGLASVGHKFFIHQFYVSKLLQLFEYGNRRVEKVNERLHQTRERKRKLSLIQEGTVSKQEPVIESESETDSAYGEELEFDRNNIQTGNFGRNRSASLGLGEQKHDLDLFAVSDFARLGIQAIVDDQVTKRFAAKELQTWNLLTRTDKFYHYKSLRLAGIWLTGTIFRYFIMFPVRLIICIFGVIFLIFITGVIGVIFPDGSLKRWIYYSVSIMCFRMCSRGFSGVITYHNPENKARGGGICVANHTSPIDVVILHCDNSYALVGQKQGGFLGVVQRALARAADHIWFERFEMTDRQAVSRRLKEHSEDKRKLPILIFPEGTCVNNSAVMMFKKGSFEVGATIYPVAVKYDSRFGDPFWNSSKYGYMKYLLMMMTSWAIVCDVWYLPPMTREEGESAIEFAARVKAEIANKGGLVDLGNWDGQLKRQKVKPEWVKMQQLHFSQTVDVPAMKKPTEREDLIDNGIDVNRTVEEFKDQ